MNKRVFKVENNVLCFTLFTATGVFQLLFFENILSNEGTVYCSKLKKKKKCVLLCLNWFGS